MKNIILFGGAFDPIHNGHLNMAFFASKTLDADVFFIPAKKSVWKSESAPISDKINMIKLAIKDYKRFHISTYEADKKDDVTYSIETIRYFVSEYKDCKFYFLIGVDQVNEFHRWKECDEIAKLVKLIYFHRPGFEPNKENINRFQMMELDSGEYSTAASKDIRELRCMETPIEVIDYIIYNNIYQVPRYKEYYTEHRLAHSLSVAHLAYEIAKKNNYHTPGRAFLAGMMHDIGKHVDGEYAVEIMNKEFKQYASYPSWAYHQFVGSYIAKTEFGIVDEDILKAIKFHATGCANMSELQKIVYASDKIDPSRDYDSTKYIKAMMESINSGFIIVLNANIEFLHKKVQTEMNPLTKECVDFYLE